MFSVAYNSQIWPLPMWNWCTTRGNFYHLLFIFRIRWL